ncbi:MAG: SLOG family protein [Muribaculaceae bacterium]|nr:SLOG family protein [Muribaculaceae bacterium]
MGKVCAFLGNDYDFMSGWTRHHTPNENIKTRLREQIINLIENEDVSTFFVGELGGYEVDAYDAVLDVKEQYPNIFVIFVVAKMTEHKLRVKNANGTTLSRRACDDFIYPDKCATGYKRLCIVYRNRYIIENTNFIISYNKYQGKAYDFCQEAKKKGVEVIELTELYDFD